MSGEMPPNNHPAAGKAGMASLFAFVHHWPGLPEPVFDVAEEAMRAASSWLVRPSGKIWICDGEGPPHPQPPLRQRQSGEMNLGAIYPG
jgi:hypothetical protein